MEDQFDYITLALRKMLYKEKSELNTIRNDPDNVTAQGSKSYYLTYKQGRIGSVQEMIRKMSELKTEYYSHTQLVVSGEVNES